MYRVYIMTTNTPIGTLLSHYIFIRFFINSPAPRIEQMTISAAVFSKTTSKIRKYLKKCCSFLSSGQYFFNFFQEEAVEYATKRQKQKRKQTSLGVDELICRNELFIKFL